MERDVYDNMRRIERSHWWFRARREILSDQLEQFGLSKDARILEVGCGTGGNLPMLARYGAVTGMEPDAESREYAMEQTGISVLPGFLPGPLPDFGGPFDLVTAFDVIEHVDQDLDSVVALGDLLKPGGRMLTTVPAHPWMWSAHDAAHHHKRRYRKAEFLRLFQEAGLRLIKTSYFNTLLFPPIAAVRLVKRRADGGDDALPSATVNRLLTSVFAFEKHLLRMGSLPFGVSLLVAAERPA